MGIVRRIFKRRPRGSEVFGLLRTYEAGGCSMKLL